MLGGQSLLRDRGHGMSGQLRTGDSGVPLAAAISALRSELLSAAVGGGGTAIQFEVPTIELTLQATVTWVGEANAGIRWWLIDAGAKTSQKSGTVQTVKVTLSPKQDDGTGHYTQAAKVDAADSPASTGPSAADQQGLNGGD